MGGSDRGTRAVSLASCHPHRCYGAQPGFAEERANGRAGPRVQQGKASKQVGIEGRREGREAAREQARLRGRRQHLVAGPPVRPWNCVRVDGTASAGRGERGKIASAGCEKEIAIRVNLRRLHESDLKGHSQSHPRGLSRSVHAVAYSLTLSSEIVPTSRPHEWRAVGRPRRSHSRSTSHSRSATPWESAPRSGSASPPGSASLCDRHDEAVRTGETQAVRNGNTVLPLNTRISPRTRRVDSRKVATNASPRDDEGCMVFAVTNSVGVTRGGRRSVDRGRAFRSSGGKRAVDGSVRLEQFAPGPVLDR